MYLFFIIVLFVLAATDLMVGVSNDAVNFLNSAVGSRAGSRRLILLVAALGIMAGVLFSSGMMEVARKGIFNPQMFTFAEVMAIFMAVMLADILLLDLFNTYGMPTSTTVSIVFELLGAAFVLALLRTVAGGEGDVLLYLNTSKAQIIVGGIFLSVFVAFSAGVVAQFGSRLIFGFNYHKQLCRLGGLWGGLSITILSYFLLIKGLKGSVFVTPHLMNWVHHNTWWLLITIFLTFTLLFQFLVSFTRVNILRVIVLAGTFTLAMAFAGNDLVNFIGVPLAGLASYSSWQTSGANPAMLMHDLAGKVATPGYLLLLAGLIMVVTLWRSKKARKVTATEVNLSWQGRSAVRFTSNFLARLLVQIFGKAGRFVQNRLPVSWRTRLAAVYQQRQSPEDSKVAFDLLRASVNLTVASILISLATLYKLPLSTTYVSFMVAMGTSLADRAWGYDAAGRVAGVIRVIGGWLLTAVVAFVVAGVFVVIIFKWGLAGVVLLLALLAGALWLTHRSKMPSLSQGLPRTTVEQGLSGV